MLALTYIWIKPILSRLLELFSVHGVVLLPAQVIALALFLTQSDLLPRTFTEVSFLCGGLRH